MPASKETEPKKNSTKVTFTDIKIGVVAAVLLVAFVRGNTQHREEQPVPDVIPSSTPTTPQPESILHTGGRK